MNHHEYEVFWTISGTTKMKGTDKEDAQAKFDLLPQGEVLEDQENLEVLEVRLVEKVEAAHG